MGSASPLVRALLAGILVLGGLLSGVVAAQSATLDQVRARGHLVCGVNTGLAGFSAPDDRGRWTGIDIDFCRAVAAAIFKDGNRVRFVPLNAKERFTALQSGEVDVLSRNTTWTMSRDTSLGLNFTGVIYYDGQAFMARRALGLKSAADLAGSSICVQSGTTNELNLSDFFATRGLSYRPVVFERLVEVLGAYISGRCDAFTTDSSQLISERTRLPDPDTHEMLPDLISKEPLGPVVRQGDAGWSNIVRWTLFALINAEELGITQGNVEEMRTSSNPEIRRILGTDGEFGRGIGLDNDWVVSIIKTVGNYGEAFERNLGQGSALKIARGRNALWKDGGLMYAPPIR
ncbi:amino acid ABC transporter substrate-binding protein [Hyphomicrobium sp. LHD-15]|uniref:amino acid ABC transporter substrate-binding protein n=1 Tax=Hyphomicrobium sp. LHD-15 TaxID=3072142 RepID=UPI00280DA809|nr:amino acid ABC transporter substrate-binding protein [Hyphomicrobium sp. LHD-15]MDQ8697825.1 amino acid ABC transporter substrate-binding protein [Hyphomicrobium sp. LHD-15]